jgi:hypothetical protein
MSTLIVPFGRSNALVPPEAAQNVALARYQMRTLQDLLNALAVVVPPAAPMLRTSAAHFAEFVGQPPDVIEIATLVDRKEGFRRYLKGRRYQVNSVRTSSTLPVSSCAKRRSLAGSGRRRSSPSVGKRSTLLLLIEAVAWSSNGPSSCADRQRN